jgi:hypothetical protein
MIPTKKKQSERHFLRYRIRDKVIVLCENRVDLDEMLDSFVIPSFSEFLVIVQFTMFVGNCRFFETAYHHEVKIFIVF